jgi:hypothetical protein
MPAATPSGAIGLRRRQHVAGAVEEAVDLMHRRRPLCQGLGAGGVDLDDQGPAGVGLGVEELQQGAEPGAQLPCPGALARSRGQHLPPQPLDAGVVGVQIAVVLVGEVVVEGLAVDAGAVEHGPHRGALVAFGPHRFQRAVEDALALRRTHELEVGTVFGLETAALRACQDLGFGAPAHRCLSCHDQGNRLSRLRYCSGM